MAVWTLKMNIIGKPEVFNFCKTEKLIGFGWGLPDDYLEKLKIKEIQEIEKYDDLRKSYSPHKSSRQLTTCINAFKKMRPEDFIWTLGDSENSYYLCKITGRYKYLKEEFSKKYGIANCMEVCGYNPVSENLVPSDVKRLLHSSGIIYKLSNGDQETATVSLYEMIKNLNP